MCGGWYVACLCCSKVLLWLQLKELGGQGPTLIMADLSVRWGTESRTEVNPVSTDPCTWELPVTTTEGRLQAGSAHRGACLYAEA